MFFVVPQLLLYFQVSQQLLFFFSFFLKSYSCCYFSFHFHYQFLTLFIVLPSDCAFLFFLSLRWNVLLRNSLYCRYLKIYIILILLSIPIILTCLISNILLASAIQFPTRVSCHSTFFSISCSTSTFENLLCVLLELMYFTQPCRSLHGFYWTSFPFPNIQIRHFSRSVLTVSPLCKLVIWT